MNQPVKPKPTPPSTGATDASESDWGLDVSKKRGASETRIGLLLVVVLVGALGYLTYRKLQERGQNPSGFGAQDGAVAVESETGDAPVSPGEQNELLTGAATGWSALPGDQSNLVDDSSDRRTDTAATDFTSLPPAQREPDEAPPRTFADDSPLEFVAERSTPVHQPEPEPVANDSGWNPFATDTALEPLPPANSREPQEVVGAGTAPNTQFGAPRGAAAEWLNTAASDAAELREPNGPESARAVEREPLFTADSPTNQDTSETAADLFGAAPQPAAPETIDADIVVETSDRPLPEPLLVPAEDVRVLPVASDGTARNFTQQAVGETTTDDPWGTSAPRELVQSENPPAVQFELGDASSTPAADTNAAFGSDPGYPAASGQPPATTENWNRDPAGTSRSTSTGSDPFSQSSAFSGTTRVTTDEVTIHVVQSGDNFWTIAHKYYRAGRYANALAAFNQSRIPDPRKMRPGMKVLVPDKQVLVQRFPRLTGAAYGPGSAGDAGRPGFFVDRSGQPAYRVGKGDTLSAIAARHLGRSSRSAQILGMNRDQLKDANSLKIGMVLKLPMDATQVGVLTESTITR